MIIHTGSPCFFLVRNHGVGRHSQYRQIFVGGLLTYLVRCSIAIHYRHIDIHEDTVVAVLCEFVQGFLPIAGYLHDKLCLLQKLGRHLLVNEVVLGEQDAGALYWPQFLHLQRLAVATFPGCCDDLITKSFHDDIQQQRGIDRLA